MRGGERLDTKNVDIVRCVPNFFLVWGNYPITSPFPPSPTPPLCTAFGGQLNVFFLEQSLAETWNKRGPFEVWSVLRRIHVYCIGVNIPC